MSNFTRTRDAEFIFVECGKCKEEIVFNSFTPAEQIESDLLAHKCIIKPAKRAA